MAEIEFAEIRELDSLTVHEANGGTADGGEGGRQAGAVLAEETIGNE